MVASLNGFCSSGVRELELLMYSVVSLSSSVSDMSCEEYVEKQLASLQDKVNKTQKSSP